MKKFVVISLLLSAFAVSVNADFETSSGGYVCHAKDYENLWFQGWSADSVADAEESAIRACRQGSLAPETCEVRACGAAK